MMNALFILFAAASVTAALMVITRRTPIYAALWLVVTLAAQAGLFTLLGAFFVATIQILIYAGAIMILFLFVIMALRSQGGGAVPRGAVWAANIAAAGLLAAQLLYIVFTNGGAALVQPVPAPEGTDHVAAIGNALFTTYLIPFEIGSVLLLVTVVGAVLLTRTDPAPTAQPDEAKPSLFTQFPPRDGALGDAVFPLPELKPESAERERS